MQERTRFRPPSSWRCRNWSSPLAKLTRAGGPRKLRAWLQHRYPGSCFPSASCMSTILQRQGSRIRLGGRSVRRGKKGGGATCSPCSMPGAAISCAARQCSIPMAWRSSASSIPSSRSSVCLQQSATTTDRPLPRPEPLASPGSQCGGCNAATWHSPGADRTRRAPAERPAGARPSHS